MRFRPPFGQVITDSLYLLKQSARHLAKLKTCTLYWELINPLSLGMKLLKRNIT